MHVSCIASFVRLFIHTSILKCDDVVCFPPSQLKGYGVSVITGVDPNVDNFVSAGIINTRTTLIGCLLRLEPNKDTTVSGHNTVSTLVLYLESC